MVAVPPLLVVERHDEGVLALEQLERRLRASHADDRVGQGPAHLSEDRGPEQEVPDARSLPREHLLEEVVDDEAVSAQRLDQRGDVGPPPKRERREL